MLPIFGRAEIKNLEIWAAFPYGSERHFPYWEKGYIDTFARHLKTNGLKTKALHAPFSETLDISSLDDSSHREAIREIKEVASLFKKLPGAEIVVVHPGGIVIQKGEEEERRRLEQSRKGLKELAHFLSANGLRLAVENMLPGLIAWNPSDLLFLTEGLPQTGVCLDTGHAYISGVLEEFLERLKEKIIAFHLSDTYDSVDRHLLPFEGSIDWSFFKENGLGKEGNQAILTFETRTRGNLQTSLIEMKAAFQKLIA